jgi:hypothetical protein
MFENVGNYILNNKWLLVIIILVIIGCVFVRFQNLNCAFRSKEDCSSRKDCVWKKGLLGTEGCLGSMLGSVTN